MNGIRTTVLSRKASATEEGRDYLGVLLPDQRIVREEAREVWVEKEAADRDQPSRHRKRQFACGKEKQEDGSTEEKEEENMPTGGTDDSASATRWLCRHVVARFWRVCAMSFKSPVKLRMYIHSPVASTFFCT